MMSARETIALDEEEGAEEEDGCKEGVVGATSENSTRCCFVASYAALLQIDSLLMAPIT